MIDALIALRVPLLGLASVLAVESASRLGASLLGGLVRGFSLPGLLASVALGLVGAFGGTLYLGIKRILLTSLRILRRIQKTKWIFKKKRLHQKLKHLMM